MWIPKSPLDIAQRKGDGKFVLWALMPDPNAPVADRAVHRPPRIWQPVGVFASRAEAENSRAAIQTSWNKGGKR